MTTLTPHADAVRQGLADMRARYDATSIANKEHATERRLTLGLTEVVMTMLGEKRDARMPDEAIVGAIQVALGNVVATLTSSVCGERLAPDLARVLMHNVWCFAVHRLANIDPDSMNQIDVAMPASTAGHA